MARYRASVETQRTLGDAEPQCLRPIDGRALDGRAHALPDGLSKPYMYVLPVLSARYGPVRWLIDGGMSRGIPDPAARARTITVYTDVEAVVANLGLAGTDTIAVVAVEPTDRILACETGGFVPRKAKRLAEVLHRPVLEEPERPSRVNEPTVP